MSKVLVLSTTDSHLGGQGWSMAELCKKRGHEVCFVCLRKSMPDTENYFFNEKNKLEIRRFFFLAYDKLFRNIMSPDPMYSFQSAGLSYISANRILKKCPFKPDVIFITWVATFLTPKVIRDLYDKTHARMVMPMIDEALLGGLCHYHCDCDEFLRGCKNCPHVKRLQCLPRRTMNEKIKYWTDMPFHSMASGYDTGTAKVTPFLKSGTFHTTETVADCSPVYSKSEARKFFGVGENDFVMFTGANSLGEKRKGMHILIEACNLLAQKIDGCRKVTLLILGNGSAAVKEQIDNRIDAVAVPFLPQKDFFKAYYACDIYVSPTLADSGPMMVNYAMACGRPSVAFPIGCAVDFINENTGFIAEYGNARQFCDGMLYFYHKTEDEMQRYIASCQTKLSEFKDAWPNAMKAALGD